MEVRGPLPRVGHCRVIVHERVEPDVRHVVRVEGQRDAPLQPLARPRDAEVVQRVLEELQHLLLAIAREDEVLVRRQEIHEPGLVARELEEIVGLRDLGHVAEDLRPGAVGLPVLFLQELLLPGGIDPLVLGLVDPALVVQLLEQPAHDRLVPRLGRADEIVVGDAELRQQSAEGRAGFVDVLLGRDAELLGGHLNLLAVLVHAREEIHLVAHHPAEPGNDVSQHLFIGVAEVRGPIYVVDGGGEVERLHAGARQQKPPRVKCRKF